MWRRGASGRLAVLLGTLAAALGACSRGRSEPRAVAGTAVVLVSIDTLRADRLPAYGHRGVETPHIDALRQDAVLFENAYTHCPLTLPAHVSMLTGQLPSEHGVRDNIGYVVPAAPHGLPHLLRARGYATGAAVSAYVLRGATGLRDGFDFYDEVAASAREGAAAADVQRPASASLAAAVRWLETARGRPFFLFLHLYEPHTPYEPPEPFRTRWGATYEGEIAAADAAVGELIANLRRDGLYDRALLVLVSDHGEGLGDHGEEEHGILLYREAVRVPLMIKLPRSVRGGTAVGTPAGLADLLPTINAALGLASPSGLTGRDLLAGEGSATGRSVTSETYYPRIHLGWSELRSVVDERYHYIDGPKPELYDVVRDPAERANLLAQQPAVANAMKAVLDRPDTRFAGPGRVEPEARERLAALGYLSGGMPTPAGHALPNPRDHIHVRAQLKHAFQLARSGDDAGAVAALRRVLASHPRLFDARVEQAAALARLGRPEEALEAYGEAARTSPEMAGTIALSRARLHLELSRFDQAATEARAAAASEPGWAHEVLARIALARDDLVEAEREARLAQADPAVVAASSVVLAQVSANRGDLAGALRTLDGAQTREGADAGPVPGLQFVRGDTLARLGRHAEAEDALRSEIRAFPRNTRAYASLAIVRALQGGNLAESRQILEDMHRARPVAATALLAVKTLQFIGDTEGAAGWRGRAGAVGPARSATSRGGAR